MFKINVRTNPAAPNIQSTADLHQTPRVSLERLNISREMVQRNVGQHANDQPQNDSLDEANFNWDEFGSAVKTPGLVSCQLAQRASGVQPLDIGVTMRERGSRKRAPQPHQRWNEQVNTYAEIEMNI
jgi:hypothetical protein